MPLVTRSSVTGNVFKQAAQPSDWQDGDIWVDTDNGQVWVNDSGTAYQFGAGTLNQGDILYSDSDENLATLAKGTATQVLTMNAGATAPEWADGGGAWEILDNHTASGAESSYTFTPGTAIDMDNYSQIVLEFDGESTASLRLGIQINGQTATNYNNHGDRVDSAGTETIFTDNSADSVGVLTASAITGANNRIMAITHLQGASAGTDRILGFSQGSSDGTISELTYHDPNFTFATITSLKYVTSTSTWKTGTRITIYGVKRA